MPDITQILNAIEEGDAQAADELLPVVYEELRKLAAQRMRQEGSGQTLQATALVHEAYLRLIGPDDAPELKWDSRGHFFAAAAEAMRRILIERARAKGAAKRGGNWKRINVDLARVSLDELPPELLDLDDALSRFREEEPEKARLVTLRFFAGLNMAEAAAVLGISTATATRHWAYARVWLYNELSENQEKPEKD